MSEEVSVGVVGRTVAVGVGVCTSSLIQPANITTVMIATIAIIPKKFFLSILFSSPTCEDTPFGIKRVSVFAGEKMCFSTAEFTESAEVR